MAFTTAPIAGKLATCEWLTPMPIDSPNKDSLNSDPPNTDAMTNEPCRDRVTTVVPVEMTLTNDARLLAAVDTIINQMALSAGFAEQAKDLAAATIQICQQTFLLGGVKGDASSPIHVGVANYPDRIEIVVQSNGVDVADKSLKTTDNAAKAGEEKIREVLESVPVDRFQFETLEGRQRITLIKYCGAAKSRTNA
jgi:hypothetical protein